MRYLSRMSRKNIQSLIRDLSSLQRYCEYVWRSSGVGSSLWIELPLTRYCSRIYIFDEEDIFVEIKCRAIDSLSDWRKLENFSSCEKTRREMYRLPKREPSLVRINRSSRALRLYRDSGETLEICDRSATKRNRKKREERRSTSQRSHRRRHRFFSIE